MNILLLETDSYQYHHHHLEYCTLLTLINKFWAVKEDIFFPAPVLLVFVLKLSINLCVSEIDLGKEIAFALFS